MKNKNINKTGSGAAVGSSAWLGHIMSMLDSAKPWRIVRIAPRYLSTLLLIYFHKALYRFQLRRQSLGLPLHREFMRRRLLDTERQLVAKHGSDWRLCVFDNEVVHFLKFSNYVHGVLWPNDPSSATGPTARVERKEDVR